MKRRDFFKFAATPILAPMVVRVALASSTPPTPVDTADLTWPAASGRVDAEIALMNACGEIVRSQPLNATIASDEDGQMCLCADTGRVTFLAVQGHERLVGYGVTLLGMPNCKAVMNFPSPLVADGGDITLMFTDGKVLSFT